MHLLKYATKSAAGADGCCMPSDVYQGIAFEVTASWDVHANLAGYNFFTLQVDTKNKLLYSHQSKVSPAPKQEQLEIWYTPGAVQGTWFQFLRGLNVIDPKECFVATLKAQPTILDPVCYKAPQYEYGGDLFVSTHNVQVWEKKTGRYNSTTFVDPTVCIPQTDLGFGWDQGGDFMERETSFVNVQFTITDPAHFIPPTGCKPIGADQQSAVRQALQSFPRAFGFTDA